MASKVAVAGHPLRHAVGMAALSVLLAAGYGLQLLGVVLAGTWPVVAGAVLGVGCEALMLRRFAGLARRLTRTQFSRPVRQVLRDGLLLGGLARLGVLNVPAGGVPAGTGRPGGAYGIAASPYAVVLLVALFGCWVAHFLCQGVGNRVRRARRLPFVTRNVDTSGLRLSPAPPALLDRLGSWRLTLVAALVTAASAVSAGTGDVRWCALTAAVCCVSLCAGVVLLALRLLPGRRPVGEEEALDWLDAWLATYRPTVGMYFSGSTSTAYQANMWLPTLEALPGRPIVVLRERSMVQRIDATGVPVLCLPKVAHLMRLGQCTLSVLLHPANSGKTSQVLRIPTIKHAFINHGESDKLSSCNPYAKAYDQVWVAGPAARERYRLADIGVADADVVEVGRPQLSAVLPYTGPPPAGSPTTVLYAPTWEGWTDDPGNTSIILAGENIVRALLADPGVRLLYKPHPMTGSVDPEAAEADRRIRALITEANAGQAAERSGGARGDAQGADAAEARARAEARADLARREEHIAELTATGFGRGADEPERMLWQSAPEPHRAEAVQRAVAAWEESYWATAPPGEHRIVVGRRPGIHSCFNEADLLISDVSSVVSDYLGSEKPYAVVNTTGWSEEEFRAGFPTVRAATILSPSAREIGGLLESVREPGGDALRAARAELKAYLLGPSEPPSTVRFGRAVRELRAEAEEHRARSAALWRAAGEPEPGVPPRSAAAVADPPDPAGPAEASPQLLADALGDEEGPRP